MNNDTTLMHFIDNFSTSEAQLMLLILSLTIISGILYFKVRKKPNSTKNLKSTSSVSTKSSELSDVEDIKNLDQAAWLQKLWHGLGKTRNALLSNIQSLFQGNPINDETLNSLHETLYRSDISAKTVDRLIDRLKVDLKESAVKEPSWEFIKDSLSQEMEKILDLPFVPSQAKPKVILIVGVNGVGKTTTIGKLAAHYLAENKSVLICAADTYRAAAIDQLQVWGERLKVKVIAHQEGSDPAAVAFDSVKAAVSRNMDVLLIDTAGRLHNKKHLMDELAKITRIIRKEIPDAPHETLLVLDATTGQNAFMQLKAFQEIVKITGICMTKLDGTAKGGVVLGLADEFRIPIQYVGVGEKSSDLRKFKAKDFVHSLLS